MGVLIAPPLSLFHSLLPLSLVMKPPGSAITVPRLSVGIIPLGPKTLPSLGAMARTRSGVDSIKLAWCLPDNMPSISSVPPTMSAPARLALSAARPSAKTRIRSTLAGLGEKGREIRPRGTAVFFPKSNLTTSS